MGVRLVTDRQGAGMKLTDGNTIGDILIERGLISKSQLDMALKVQEPGRKSAESIALIGLISSDELAIIFEWQLGETIVGLGYADEKSVFGALRIGVVPRNYHTVNVFNSKDLKDFSDF